MTAMQQRKLGQTPSAAPARRAGKVEPPRLILCWDGEVEWRREQGRTAGSAQVRGPDLAEHGFFGDVNPKTEPVAARQCERRQLAVDLGEEMQRQE